jgi:two-component system, OmpR family, phosphate regulon response regulator PhoB
MPKKILIFEDEPDILSYLLAVLQDNGFSPITIDAQGCVADAVKAAGPDLIILDVMMPLRSGISIYRELRSSADLENIPVVIMSGFTSDCGNITNGFQQMVPEKNLMVPDGFIDKPIDVKAMVALVIRLTQKE